MVQHAAIESAQCHEPKHITTSATSDAGKVITPSATTAGTSELRRLDHADLNLRVVALVDGATIASDADTTDQATVTLGGNRTLGEPSGTPRDGQEICYRVTQDGTGSRILSFDPVFTFQGGLPTPDIAAGTVAYYAFRWNAVTSKWEQFIKPVGASGNAYSGKTIQNNTTVVAVPAMTDAVNFSTAADWRQVTGVFESPDVAPSANITRNTDDLTVLVTGVYRLEATITVEDSVNNTTVGLTFGVNGSVVVARNSQMNCGTAGTRRVISAHGIVALTAGQTVSAWVAADSASNVLIRQGRMSIHMIDRTA